MAALLQFCSFILDGCSIPYRLDRDRNETSVTVHAREDTPRKFMTKHSFKEDIKGLFVEINFRKSKWLLGGTKHPPSQPDQYFLAI